MENMRGKLYVGPICDYLNDCCLLLYIITAVTVFCLCIYKLLSLLCFDVIVLDKIIFGCLYIIVCDHYNVCSADFMRFFDDMTLK